MTLNRSGYVGIGITSLKTIFSINAGSGAYPTLGTNVTSSFFVSRNDGLIGMYLGYASDGNGWIQQMRNDSATAANLILQPVGGSVGIGTINCIYSTLNIKATGTALYNGISIYSTNGTETFLGMGNSGTECGFFATYGATGAYIPITFSTNGAEKMRITTDGYTKMSSTGTYVNASGYYHECYGGAANGYTLIVASPLVTPLSQYMFDMRFTAATPNNGAARFFNCGDSTATRAYMRSNGGLSNFQANNTDLSDIRTKKDIVSLESYWNKFKALEIVKYKYKDQTHDDFNIGVIAQQVESVAPEFVDVDGWDRNDIESESPLKSIYTKDLYHATIKVLQEAMAKIESLQTQNDALQSRIETLESK